MEKRGAERRLERAEQVTNGHKTESSWDLPDAASNEDSTTSCDGPPSFEFSRSQSQEEAIAAARRRDALLENRLSASQYSVSNPDYLDPSAADSRTTRRSRSASANSSGQGATRLTHNVVIERLGARFERGLPEKPLCGLILPTQAPSTPKAEAVGEKDRFLLVGTAAGLYLVDLDPTLSPIGPLRNRASSSPSSSRAPRPPLETNILPLWLNAGVHHIESYLEPARANSEGAKGLIVMLVSNEVVGGVEIKMWTLSALINLVKWRVFNEVRLARVSAGNTRSLSDLESFEPVVSSDRSFTRASQVELVSFSHSFLKHVQTHDPQFAVAERQRKTTRSRRCRSRFNLVACEMRFDIEYDNSATVRPFIVGARMG